MFIKGAGSLLTYKCECEFQFTVWSTTSAEDLRINQAVYYCPMCGSDKIKEVRDESKQR